VSRYYDLDAANARVVELRPLLEELRADRDAVAEAQRELERFRATNGNSHHADELERRQQHIVSLVRRMEAAVRQIDAWGVTLRDIGSGLVDLPALVSGRPVWLCWRLGEGDIAWWHEYDAGYDGRRPLVELA
jgi:hypothetical protein